MFQMRLGIRLRPMNMPRTPPTNVAETENRPYFKAIAEFEKPSAFRVPISLLSSSTIRAMDIRLIKTAIT